jgi:hypothetical protein
LESLFDAELKRRGINSGSFSGEDGDDDSPQPLSEFMETSGQDAGWALCMAKNHKITALHTHWGTAVGEITPQL